MSFPPGHYVHIHKVQSEILQNIEHHLEMFRGLSHLK